MCCFRFTISSVYRKEVAYQLKMDQKLSHWRQVRYLLSILLAPCTRGLWHGTVACLPAICQAGMSQDHPPCLLLRQGANSSGAHAFTHSRCSSVSGPEIGDRVNFPALLLIANEAWCPDTTFIAASPQFLLTLLPAKGQMTLGYYPLHVCDEDMLQSPSLLYRPSCRSET